MKTKIIKCVVAILAVLVGACTTDMPEYLGTNVSIQHGSNVTEKRTDGYDYEFWLQLDGLSNAQDEEIDEVGIDVLMRVEKKIQYGFNSYRTVYDTIYSDRTILLENKKISELVEDNSMKLSHLIKDLNYNRTYLIEYSYFYRSEKQGVNVCSSQTKFTQKQSVIDVVDVSSGEPYSHGFSCVTIPVQLNVSNGINEVGVDYSQVMSATPSYRISTKTVTKNVDLTIRGLSLGNWYYRCYVNDGSTTKYSEWYKLNIPAVKTDIAVDLGLSVKWAPYNVGSDSEWYNYNYYYLCEENEYNIAKLYAGSDWKIPSKTHLEELIEKCDWEHVSDNGCEAYKITGPNGNYIIIPCSGYRSANSSLIYDSNMMYLISSSYGAYGAYNYYDSYYGLINNSLEYLGLRYYNTTSASGYPIRMVVEK